MPKTQFGTVVSLPLSETFNLVSDFQSFKDILPIIETVEVLEQKGESAIVKFKFHNQGPLALLARQFGFATDEQISNIDWDRDRRISARSIKGPLKSMFMNCTMEPGATGGTKVKLDIEFDTGFGWLANNAALFFITAQAAPLTRNPDAEIAEILKRSQQRICPPS